MLFAILKNIYKFIEYKNIIPVFHEKWNIKQENKYKNVHLIVDIAKFLPKVHLLFNSTSAKIAVLKGKKMLAFCENVCYTIK